MFISILGTLMSSVKAAKLIEMPFGVRADARLPKEPLGLHIDTNW